MPMMNLISRVARVAACLRQTETAQGTVSDLSGRGFLVTGGAAGIGAETSRSLARMGAHVLVACRSKDKGERFSADVLKENKNARLTILEDSDTSDLESMRRLASRVRESGIDSLDGLILNAGIAVRPYATSAQGYELHCATNALGHHLLARSLLPVIAQSALKRLVGVTGDIYILANDCTLDYRYGFVKTLAYARSKLGVLWNMLTLHEFRESLGAPDVRVLAVHPGVVASNLIDGFDRLKARFLISPEQGAQTSIIAATEPGVESGAYLHNTLGHVAFSKEDPAMNSIRRLRFWNECEEAIAPYL